MIKFAMNLLMNMMLSIILMLVGIKLLNYYSEVYLELCHAFSIGSMHRLLFLILMVSYYSGNADIEFKRKFGRFNMVSLGKLSFMNVL